MAIQHASISDPLIHEPKGASTASVGTVYISNGSGSGTWAKVDTNSLDMASLLGAIQDDVDSGALELTGYYYLTVVIPDISTASSVIVPVIEDSEVVEATVVLGGTITVADATISFKNSAGASMGTDVTVPYNASAKGDQYPFTATGNNVLSGPSWLEVATDGGSTDTAPVSITIKLKSILNA